MFSIVICTLIISISGAIKASESEIIYINSPTSPTWVPVLFGLITPCFFTSNGILTKHLTGPKVNFNPSRLSFSSYFIVNFIIMIYAIIYWQSHPFDSYLFWFGLAGSIVNTLGIVCIQNALSLGPAGPVSAMAASASFFLVIIEAIK